MTQIDQELPGRQQRHGRSRRVNMVDARFAREVRCRHADIFGIGLAAFHDVLRETDHRVDLVADAKSLHAIVERGDDAGHVRSEDQRKGGMRLPLGGKRAVAVTEIPVRRIEADRVDADQYLTSRQGGAGRILVAEHVRAAERVQANRLHCLAHHCLLRKLLN